MDFERASMLLHIVKECIGHPNLKPMHDAAMSELLEMQDEFIASQVPAEPPPAPAEAHPLFNQGQGSEVERRV